MGVHMQASNKMDAILSSTPKAVVGVTQFTPTGAALSLIVALLS